MTANSTLGRFADDFRGSRMKSEDKDKGSNVAKETKDLCKCTHSRDKHHNDRDCLALVDPKLARYCKCWGFRSEKQ